MRRTGPVTGREVFFQEGEYIVSRTNPKGVITYANDAFVRLSGYTREELIGQAHNLVRHPDMPPEGFADLWKTIQNGQSWLGIVKNRAKNGDHYWVRAAVSPTYGRDGKIDGYVSVRVKPTRAEVDAAEKAYAKIRAGNSGLEVVRGQARPAGWVGRMQSLGASLRVKIALNTVLVCFLGGAGLLAALMGHLALSSVFAGVALVALIALGAALPAAVYRRINAIRDALEQVAAGRFDGAVDLATRDEFAPAFLAVAALQTRLGYLSSSEREARAELLREFDDSVGTVIAELGRSITSLEGTAAAQGAVAKRVADGASIVAAATSELSASIHEIAHQTAGVSGNASAAADAANMSRETMGRLAHAANDITAVSKLIASIAEQTNLLALNATIEASRAGVAGRGFAVVAGEVKTLAQQTQGATGEISSKIGAVQGDTQAAASALDALGEAITTLDGISQSIAAAVEQQAATVKELANTAEQVAGGARETGDAAADVQAASQAIARGNNALSDAVMRFRAA